MSARRQELFFVFLCALILIWQLFLPGYIGMANNGDFGKVIGPLCIDSVDHSAYCFLYFQASYVRGPSYCYQPHISSSEIALAWIASTAEQIAGDPGRFHIHWLSTIHTVLFLGFYFALLVALRPAPNFGRVLLSIAALWIFADVGLVAYLNSFYTDVAAILGGLAAIALALYLIQDAACSWGALLLFGCAALLFVTSKAQHAIYGLVPAGLVFLVAWRSPRRGVRLLGFSLAGLLIAGMIWTVVSVPVWYGAQARFNLIFSKIAKNSREPLEDLRELGLTEADLRFVGMNAFMSATPMSDAAFSIAFGRRTSYSSIARFYVRHPGRALGILWSDLRDQAPSRRPGNLSNFQREYGQPAGALSNRMGSWSALRSWLFKVWPAHILLWFAVALVLYPRAGIRGASRFRRSVGWTGLTVTLLALAEFCFASLGDAAETYRHLLMFHVFTDVTLFLALVLGLTAGRAAADSTSNTSPVIS